MAGEISTDVASPGDAATQPRTWPLSYPQAMLWFLSKRWPEADMVHRLTVAFVEALPAHVSQEDVRMAVNEVVQRHEPLRTTLVASDGDPTQRVHEHVEVPFEVVDVTRLPTGEASAERDRVLGEFAGRPRSAFAVPPCAFVLVLGRAGERHLAGLVHHLFFDYWSARLVARQVRQQLEGTLVTADGEALQYVDYLTWEREWFSDEASTGDVDHWVNRLADMVPLRLPTDRKRPWRPQGTARRATALVDRPVMEALRLMAAARRITPYMLLTACFTRLLADWSGQDDIALPTLFAGRTQPELNDMVGYFDNIMLVRLGHDADEDVDQLIARTAQVMIADQEHHDVPLLRVLQAMPRLALLLQDPRNVWPLFHYEVDDQSLRGQSGTDRGDGPSSARSGVDEPSGPAAVVARGGASSDDDELTYSFGADLDVTLRDTEQGLYLRVLYNVDLYDHETVERLLARYGRALQRLVGPGAGQRPAGWLVEADD